MMTDSIDGDGKGTATSTSCNNNNDEDDYLDSSLAEAMAEASAFLESDDSTSLDKTIQTMAATRLCVHPEHSHSFSKVTFTLAASLRKCAGCSQPLKSRSLFGGEGAGSDKDIVKCVACSALAHRFCALSPESPWKEECPVNGKLVKAAAEAMIVTDDDEEEDEGEEEEEEVDFEVDLQDHENGISNRNRINSFVSNVSGDSMESQELDLHEDEELLKQEQEELMKMKREMGLLDDDDNDNEMNNNGDDEHQQETSTEKSNNPQNPSSPNRMRRPVLSNILRSVKGEAQHVENTSAATSGETETGDSKTKTSPMKDQSASEHHQPENKGDGEENSEVPASPSKRPWLSLRNLKAKPDTTTTGEVPEEELKRDNNNDHSEGGGDGDGTNNNNLDASNTSNTSNRRASWFQRPRKQDPNHEDSSEPPAAAAAAAATESTTTSEGSEKPPSRFNIFAKKRSQNNQVTPEKGETANNANNNEFQDVDLENEEESESVAAEEQFSMFLNVDDDDDDDGGGGGKDQVVDEDDDENFHDAVEEEQEGEIAKDGEPCSMEVPLEQDKCVTSEHGDKKTSATEDTHIQEGDDDDDDNDEILDNSESASQNGKNGTSRFSIFRRNKSSDDADRLKAHDEHDQEEIVSFEKSRSLDDGASPSGDITQEDLNGNLFGTFATNPAFEDDEDEPALPVTIEHLKELSAPKDANDDEDTNRAKTSNLPTTPTSSRSVLRMFSRRAITETASADSEQIETAEMDGSQSTSSPLKRALIRNPFRKAEEQDTDQAAASESLGTTQGDNAITRDQSHEEELLSPTSRRLRISNIFQRNKGIPDDSLEVAKSEEGPEDENANEKNEYQNTCSNEEEANISQKEDSEDEVARTSIFSRVFATPEKTAKSTEEEKVQEGAGPADENEEEAEGVPEKGTRLFRLFSKKDVHESDVTSDNVEGEEATPAAPTSQPFSLFSSFRRNTTESQASDAPNPDLAQAWTSDSPPSRWTTTTTASFHSSDEDATSDGNDENKKHDFESSTEPLHYANHPFASVSRALQDNVLTLFQRNEEEVQPNVEKPESEDIERTPCKPKSTLSWIVSPEPPQSPTGPDEVDIKQALGEIKPEPVNESTFKKFASGTYETVKAVTSAQQKMGMASVAGGIAGGVAGLMFSGPAGAVMGVRYGQTAGMLGVVLEGSLTVGVVVAGVAGGRFTAEKIQEQMEEQRVLTIGEHGVSRKVMLVRPAIRIDPAWHEICAEAQRTSPSSRTSAFSFNLFSGTDNIKHDRYEKTSDIVETEEDEIPTGEKVLLLVSRVLSDKDSFPGHVYRCLMQTFRERCEMRESLIKEKEEFPHLFETSGEVSFNMGDGVSVSVSPRARREDAHGVIKYITATLLEVRPGLASTPEITETTASVVEALVFGEVYDLVYEEIAVEATENDKKLIEKIDDFEYERFERIGVPLATKGLVSKSAIDELRRLPEMHSAADKLRHCVSFLEMISEHFSTASKAGTVMGADSLLKMVCQHIIAAKMSNINAEVAFLEEFARDEQLLRGKEGYALVTLQASLHFLNMSVDFERDIFGQENDEENIPLVGAQAQSSEIREEVGSNPVDDAEGDDSTIAGAEERTTTDSMLGSPARQDNLNGEEKGEAKADNEQDLI